MPKSSGVILQAVEAGFFNTLPKALPSSVYVVSYRDGRVQAFSSVPSFSDRWGSRFCYVVDMAERRVRDSFTVPTRTDAYSFTVEAEATWKVTSPEAVVRANLNDGNEVVLARLKDELWVIGRDYAPDDAAMAEAAARAALSTARGLEEGVTILRATARFQVDTHLTMATIERDADTHKGTLESQRMARLRQMFDGSDEAMVMMHLLQHPDDTASVLQMMAEARDKVQAVRLDLLDRLIEHHLITDADAQPLRDALLRKRDALLGKPSSHMIEIRPIPSPATPTASGERISPARHLAVDFPERAPEGQRISLQVRIMLQMPALVGSARLKHFDVPPEGRDVTITVSAPDLTAKDDLEQDLYVPYSADSEPIRFGFVASRRGLHTVIVRAFAGGTFAGELAVQVSVEAGGSLEEGATRIADMGSLASEPGEVTLQVSMTDDGRYSFQLIGETLYPAELTNRIAGNPGEAVSALVTELRSFAAQRSPYASPALIRNRLQNLGAQLWADALPDAIRRQFWAQADKIKLFTVASDRDTVPWELLYPVDGDNDNGFLVEQFPVVRRVYGRDGLRKLPLASANYVVPPGSPQNAIDEVQAIRDRLGHHVADQGVLEHLDEMIKLFSSAPSILHFACHNQFDEATGSAINMAGGPLRPSDLAVAVQKRGLASASPLVFFNACRTAGEIPGLVQMMGWASQFMAAGAGAFLGTLWAVRSSSARTFADAFYQAFVNDRMSLGIASQQARRAIVDDDGDPTWLAYTVYGNPAAISGD